MLSAATWLWPSWCCRPLAVQGGAPGGAAQEKPLGAHVPGRPDQVADALEAEHRVEDVERNDVDAVGGVGGTGGDEAGERARLGDALFQHLAVGGLAVVEQVRAVHRLVQLAQAAVDAHLAEQRLHAEGARLVRHDRAPAACRTPCPSAASLRQDAHEHHGGGHLAPVRCRRRTPRTARPAAPAAAAPALLTPCGNVAAEGAALLVQSTASRELSSGGR